MTKQSNGPRIPKNHRVNKIHGEDEIFIVLSETFNSTEKDEEQVDREGRMQVEACHKTSHTYTYPILTPQNRSFPSCYQDESGSLLDSDLPDTTGDPESWLAPANGAASSGETSNPEHAVGNTSAVLSFKLEA